MLTDVAKSREGGGWGGVGDQCERRLNGAGGISSSRNGEDFNRRSMGGQVPPRASLNEQNKSPLTSRGRPGMLWPPLDELFCRPVRSQGANRQDPLASRSF